MFVKGKSRMSRRFKLTLNNINEGHSLMRLRLPVNRKGTTSWGIRLEM
jgi:hypothetical protein